MADSLEFSDEKLIDQLRLLGYSDIPEESLRRFKEELMFTCSEFTGSNLSESNGCQNSASISSPFNNNFDSTSVASSRFSSKTLSSIETENDIKKSVYIDSSVISANSTSEKVRKPLIRKNVRKINGKSMIFVESRSEWSHMENTDADGNNHNISYNSFNVLTPQTISSGSSYNSDSNVVSSMSHSTPHYNSNNVSSDLKPLTATMDFEEYNTNEHDSVVTLSSDSTLSSSVQKFTKRKALRSINGTPIVSVEKLPRNPQTLSQFNDMFDSPMSTTDDSSSCLSESDIGLNKVNVYPKLKRYHSDEDIRINRYYSKSFIRPSSCGSYGQRKRKTDPVQRYHEYRQYWNAFKIPGEKSHKNLRWMIREHMMAEPTIKPMEKNRYSLHFGGERTRRKSTPWQN